MFALVEDGNSITQMPKGNKGITGNNQYPASIYTLDRSRRNAIYLHNRNRLLNKKDEE